MHFHADVKEREKRGKVMKAKIVVNLLFIYWKSQLGTLQWSERPVSG